MNRRSFVRRTCGSILAACAAPFLPTPPALKPLGLAFHPKAFEMVMTPITIQDWYTLDFEWSKLPEKTI